MVEKAKLSDPNSFPMEERDDAPEIFVDGYQGATVTNGVAKFNFFSINIGVDGLERRRLVLRLACPVATVSAVSVAFGGLIQALKEAGVLEGVSDGKH